MKVELFYPGRVRSKERVRAANNGGFTRMYTPKETVDAERAIRAKAIEWKRAVGWGPHESWNGPIHLRLYCLYEPTAKGRPGFEHVYGPDIDNAMKTFMDAIQDKTIRRKRHGVPTVTFIEGILTNDSRISSITARKVYSEYPTGALLVIEFHHEQFKLNRPKQIPIDNGTVKPVDFLIGDIPILDIPILLEA